MSESCTCPAFRFESGRSRVEHRWDESCPQHGTESIWYARIKQDEADKADLARLKILEDQVRNALRGGQID